MKHIQRGHCTVNESRFQQLMLPIDMEIIIPENDPVRLACAQLEELDYRALYRAYSAKGRKSAVEPKILFQVLVYGYLCGIYSTRKLEEACRKRVDFMWLLSGQPVPDHTTISRFRTGRAQEEIGALFYQFTKKLEELGETEHNEVFIDGTKIESKANKYTFVWKKSTEKRLMKIREKAEEILGKAGLEGPVTKERLQELLEKKREEILFVHGKGKRKTPQQREWEALYEIWERWEAYEQHLFVMGNTRNSYSKTDPEATFMHMKEDHMRNGQLKPGYNVQLAVNSEYITGVGVFANRSDVGTMIPFLHELERQHGKKYQEVTADAGYESADNYLFLEHNGQIGYIKPNNYESQKTKRFRSQIGRAENMQYEEEEDCYVCREGRRLPLRRVTSEQKRGSIQTIAYYRCEDCRGCTRREACCKAKDPETPKELKVNLTLREYREKSLDRIQTEHGIQLRVNRSIQVEGAFGVLKEDRKFRRFLTGSRIKVLTELYLLCFGYNLKKLWSKKQNGRLQTHLFATGKT